ncbi:D-alanyl-D-alanine carboxypeptidase [Rhizobium sp. L1K21]|uniref:D-alanyl-D-alanine carboxypeptidase n=1 Tax=Rhizobium sp. L1K21 TaxID=2954933 RepID=UPI0020930113|nr:D-alanyl-D-alanine carboxypeptidase [Rhizobium sp. L1K21]MCO6186277.1 D-alanyl-D-alanine carboxypeptidase [Rhizobium sp. L1K21]
MTRSFRRFARVFALAALVALPAQQAFAGYAHLVIDANSGKTLLSKNADQRNYPASLTKMMVLYKTFEAIHADRIGWNSKIVMTKRGAATVPLKLGIRAGHHFTVREAVNAMIVRSANDVAEAMCDYLSGKSSCGSYLTAGAQKLGMRHTTFRNGSGLPDSKQMSTARDLGQLGLALIRDYPEEYKLFSQSSFVFRGKRIRGHNHLMARYRGMTGIKTGFINASGFNIVTAVQRDGKSLVGVVLGGRTAKSRDDRMAELLDAALPLASRHRTPRFEVPIPLERPGLNAPALVVVNAFVAPTPALRPGEAVSAAVATPRPPAPVVNTASSGGWEIQIAAVDSERAASRLLQEARSAVADSLAAVTAYSQPVLSNGKTLYRARFSGFSDQSAAHSACQDLKRRAYQCLVLANSVNG